MRRLIPDDPYFAHLFFAMKEPLLHEFAERYAPKLLARDDVRDVCEAYAAWHRVNHRMPAVLHNYARQHGVGDDRWAAGYELRDPWGQPLAPLYLVDLSDEDLGRLARVDNLLNIAQIVHHGPLLDALDEVASDAQAPRQDLVAAFGKALRILRIDPHPELLTAFRGTALGIISDVSLSPAAADAYDEHCQQIVNLISGDNDAIAVLHRAVYF